ncbi:MAG: efflux RND transporter periplasmic adaptor subunit [Planctomycetota bacterium]|nr:efflux RND transporter periplasmic adaptor subunit [Planctomycetota bacterium]
MKRLMKVCVFIVLPVAAIGSMAGWYFTRGAAQATSYQTAKVTRGDLLVTIAASGTVEPEEVVDVGAQISGQIVSFGKDTDGKTVDYGSVVAQDTVVAKIDDSLYQADVAEADAQVASAKAGVQKSEADLRQLQAKLVQTQRDWERAKKLGSSEALAQTTHDAYESAYEMAKANVAVGEAAILQAKASLTQSEKSLWRARRNLEYCTITSPIQGTVIDRRVSIGQTVAAGLNTPSLFLIAKDLRRMRVWVSVNEADISRVYSGQPVAFTVDAFPGETFVGAVCRIRPNASMTQNVVTFTVEISTDNSAGRLRPYLTANVRFEVSRRDNVLLVPATALSWTPTADQVAPEYRQGASGSGPAAPSPDTDLPPMGAPPTSHPASVAPGTTAMAPAVLWVVQGQHVRPVPVLTGMSDGTNVEVVGKELSEKVEVVTGTQSEPSAAQNDVSNPFAPKLPKPPKPPTGAGGGPPPV